MLYIVLATKCFLWVSFLACLRGFKNPQTDVTDAIPFTNPRDVIDQLIQLRDILAADPSLFSGGLPADWCRVVYYIFPSEFRSHTV